jgi:hypothetical protein
MSASPQVAQAGPAVPCHRWVVETYLYWSMIQVMAARLARYQAPAPRTPTLTLAPPGATAASTRLQAA